MQTHLFELRVEFEKLLYNCDKSTYIIMGIETGFDIACTTVMLTMISKMHDYSVINKKLMAAQIL